MINKATADGLAMIKAAGADDAVIKLKSLETFAKAANGKATKIIIPSEIQGIAGLATTVGELVRRDDGEEQTKERAVTAARKGSVKVE